jgi:hypothetical protein
VYIRTGDTIMLFTAIFNNFHLRIQSNITHGSVSQGI